MNSIISEVTSTKIAENRICFVCEKKKAEFCIRGIKKNCYCEDCAKEQFSDLSLLEKL